MQQDYYILTINPGSTSTKISYFKNLECLSSKTLRHSTEKLSQQKTVAEEYAFRKQAILDYIKEENIDLRTLSAAVGRGGLLKPLLGGVYTVSEDMLDDLWNARYGRHASNLGAILAQEFASEQNVPAYIVNPVIVDEYEPLSRYSGHPDFPRISVFHALNTKAVAQKTMEERGKRYEEVNLIIAHMGGGITVMAHKNGKAVDGNNAVEEGPFTPERTGYLPMPQLVEACYSGKYTKEEMKKLLVGKGGLVAYLGTSDAIEVEKRIDAGDEKAKEVLEAMTYQVAKEICSHGAVFSGKVDYIILTGGLAYSEKITGMIRERVGFLAPVVVFPGEDEMQAMAEGAIQALSGQEKVLTYEEGAR